MVVVEYTCPINTGVPVQNACTRDSSNTTNTTNSINSTQDTAQGITPAPIASFAFSCDATASPCPFEPQSLGSTCPLSPTVSSSSPTDSSSSPTDPSPSSSDKPTSSPSPAERLTPQQRQDIGVAALTGAQSISALAKSHKVSRKFVRSLRDQAKTALNQSFQTPSSSQHKVTSYLAITKSLLEMTVVVLVLTCHSSLRDAQEFLQVILGQDVSLGWVHSVVQHAAQKAKQINAFDSLCYVGIAALDEIYQSSSPILVAVDTASTYCCLLVGAEHRDGTTWGVHLLELNEKGFNPKASVADAAGGINKGLSEALPNTQRRFDTFHIFRETGLTARFLENQAYRAMAKVMELEAKLLKNPQDKDLAEKLREAKAEMERAIQLADDVATLERWLRQDILSIIGGTMKERGELYDFVVTQLEQRKSQSPQRLGKLTGSLKHQKEGLLMFVADLNLAMSKLAEEAKVDRDVVWKMLRLLEARENSSQWWGLEGELKGRLSEEKYQALKEQVRQLRRGVVRASSAVENLNSRLRCYFFLRREVGGDYLELLRFYLNHHQFTRSRVAGRAGKSPKELFTGQDHPHWLELLGYTPTKVNPA